MKKRNTLFLAFLSLVLTGCHSGTIVESTNTSSQNSNFLPASSDIAPDSTSTSDPLKDLTGLDLLYGIFDTYKDHNVTLSQLGVSTEYFMPKAYYIDYDPDYINFYKQMGANFYSHGFIVNPIQGIYEFTLEDEHVKVTTLESTQLEGEWMSENMINSPEDFNYYAVGENIWQEYDVENPPKIKKNSSTALKAPVFKADDSSTSSELPKDQTTSGEKELDKEAKSVFYSTDDNVKLLAGTLAGLSFNQDSTTGDYDTSSIDYVKVRINQDNTLSFNMVCKETFSVAKYDIKDVGTTSLSVTEDFFDATQDEYNGIRTDYLNANTYGKQARTEWTDEEITYFKKNYSNKILPFPVGGSYALKTYSSTSFAAFSDDACGDITASYTKQLTDAGWLLLDESGLSEDKKTEASTTYYQNLNESGSKQIRISFNYAAPKDEDARWDKGTFTANIHRYPYSI